MLTVIPFLVGVSVLELLFTTPESYAEQLKTRYAPLITFTCLLLRPLQKLWRDSVLLFTPLFLGLTCVLFILIAINQQAYSMHEFHCVIIFVTYMFVYTVPHTRLVTLVLFVVTELTYLAIIMHKFGENVPKLAQK